MDRVVYDGDFWWRHFNAQRRFLYSFESSPFKYYLRRCILTFTLCDERQETADSTSLWSNFQFNPQRLEKFKLCLGGNVHIHVLLAYFLRLFIFRWKILG